MWDESYEVPSDKNSDSKTSLIDRSVVQVKAVKGMQAVAGRIGGISGLLSSIATENRHLM